MTKRDRCAYRRTALAEAGGFGNGLYLEDSDMTLRLARQGWQTRFLARAKSFHTAPTTLHAYWKQHLRWATGFGQVARRHAWAVLFDRQIPLPQRLELAAFSSGYLDRMAVLLATALSLFGLAPRYLTRFLLIHLITPFAQATVALGLSQSPRGLWPRLLLLPFLYCLDIAIAVVGAAQAFRPNKGIWRT